MALTDDTLQAIKGALAKSDEVAKASNTINVGSGLVYYDLQAPSKKLYPVYTPLVQRIPRVTGAGGTATNWKVINNIVGSGYDAFGYVPEGQRAGAMTISAASKSASYITIGEEAQVSFEAISAGQNFEDARALATKIALQKLFLKEENMILGGNASVALGTPTAPTVANAGTGGSIGAGTYNVIVVALTLEGYLNSTRTGTLAAPTTKTITGQDGSSFTVNGGSSQKSSAGSTTTSGTTSTISASTPAVSGALAYAWYVGTSGNETLQAFTTINSIKLTSLSSGNQNASAISADNSKNNTYGCDGLLYTAFNNSTSAYINTLATGTAGTGTTLTASGYGGVSEIDTMLQNMWDTSRVSPSVIWVNSQELKNITSKVLGNNGSPLVRFPSDSGNPAAVVANGVVRSYFNPFTPNDGGREIPIMVHPTLTPGTIMAVVEDLPVQYQSNEVPNVAEIKTRRDYYQIDWPLVTRAQQFGVYAEEVLAVYAPFCLGIITNISNG